MEPYRPGFTLVDAPESVQGALVQELVHDALRRHPGKVLVYDAAHAFAPDAFAATNRRKGRPEAEHAQRCLVQRCITPFQWDTLLSKHLDQWLAATAGDVALVVAFPYGRLFATDELAEWERVDHLDFSLEHLARRGRDVPIVAVTSLDGVADQPELHRRLASVPDLVRVQRVKGFWRLDPPARSAADTPPAQRATESTETAETATQPASWVSWISRPDPAGAKAGQQTQESDAASDVGLPRIPRIPWPGGGAGNVHLALSKPDGPGWDGIRPMGMSQPTVSDQIDTFAASFAAFRANLPKREQARFDDVVTWARRHGNALNVSEDLDVIRRILLVATIALADRHHQLSDRHTELAARHDALATQVEARLRAVDAALGIPSPPETHHDLVPLRRLSQRHLEHDGGVGQVAGRDVPGEGTVPA